MIIISYRTSASGPVLQVPFMPVINSGFFFIVGIGFLSLLPKLVENVQAAISKSLFSNPDDEIRRDAAATQAFVQRGWSQVGVAGKSRLVRGTGKTIGSIAGRFMRRRIP
jgi:hypothetical protein